MTWIYENPSTLKWFCDAISLATLSLTFTIPLAAAWRGASAFHCALVAWASMAGVGFMLAMVEPFLLARSNNDQLVWNSFPDGPAAMGGICAGIGYGTVFGLAVSILRRVHAWLMERFMARYSQVHHEPMTRTPPTILFDGVCNLCAWAVRFIIERDPRNVFRFASLQSDMGKRMLHEHGISTVSMDSFVLIENGIAFTESTAALRVARHLHRAWPLCYTGIILPRMLRDPIYRFIARNRYRWFGKQDSCMMPTPALRERFLE